MATDIWTVEWSCASMKFYLQKWVESGCSFQISILDPTSSRIKSWIMLYKEMRKDWWSACLHDLILLGDPGGGRGEKWWRMSTRYKGKGEEMLPVMPGEPDCLSGPPRGDFFRGGVVGESGSTLILEASFNVEETLVTNIHPSLPLHSPVTGLVMGGAKLTGFFLARLPSPLPSALTLHRGPEGTGAGPPQPSILCNRVEFHLMGFRTGNPFASWQKPCSSTPALQAIKMRICSSSLFF